VLDETEPVANLSRIARPETEFGGGNADLPTGIEDEPIRVPGFERADVGLARREVWRDLTPLLPEEIASNRLSVPWTVTDGKSSSLMPTS
jgi:hypothetical protein